jgi:hypothetical protein
MMDAVNTYETSVNFYETTREKNPEDSHLHTCRPGNLKSHCEGICIMINEYDMIMTMPFIKSVGYNLNVGHDSLVLCPLLSIFTFSAFILNYTTISLIFAIPQFMIYSSSYFITYLFHFSLYLLKYSPTFCSLSLSLIVTILLIPISGSVLVNRLSTSSSLQLLVSVHLSMNEYDILKKYF